MRIVHFAPFAPNACGLYEAARDMVIADFLAGHESHMVDVGLTLNTGEYVPGAPGKTDARGGSFITTSDPAIIYSADILVAHTGVPDNWIAPCQAPIVWVLHGRPAACFKPEHDGKGHSYSLIAQLAQWPRVKKMVTFWPYHVQFWKPIIPESKLVCFPAPPIDQKRFSPSVPSYEFTNKGEWNILVADNWREDVDTYEVVHGIIEACKIVEGAKVHFCSLLQAEGPWRHLLQELNRIGCLGEVAPVVINMEHRYRGADLIVSPNRIAVRVIAEALSCGTPVVAAQGCEFTSYLAYPNDPSSVSDTICSLIRDLKNNRKEVQNNALRASSEFALDKYSERMQTVYEAVLCK